MTYCTKCGNPLQEGCQFCSACGTPVQQPVQAVPKPVPTPTSAPAKRGAFVPAIVSIALSGEAVAFGFLTLYFGFLCLPLSAAGMEEAALPAGIMMGTFVVLYGLFGLAFGLVSLILGVKYLKTKNPRLSALAKAGVIISAVSLGMIALGFLLAFVSLILAAL